jgi:hypothetical protein
LPDEGVFARATRQCVVTFATDNRIITAFTINGVVASATDQRVGGTITK